MNILSAILSKYKQRKDPIKYAREIGVRVGENCLEKTPAYDVERYKNDKKAEVLRMLETE